MTVTTTVNGVECTVDVPPAASLLTLLRDELGLTGSKNACEQGECGSCSVWLDGELVCACLVAAVQADGRTVRTVEDLGGADRLHPVQEAFVAAGAVQCGFCTPGFVVAVADLLEPGRDADPQTGFRRLFRRRLELAMQKPRQQPGDGDQQAGMDGKIGAQIAAVRLLAEIKGAHHVPAHPSQGGHRQ